MIILFNVPMMTLKVIFYYFSGVIEIFSQKYTKHSQFSSENLLFVKIDNIMKAYENIKMLNANTISLKGTYDIRLYDKNNVAQKTDFKREFI